MAGKQISGDSLTTNLAGMSKNQLYDIMSQMKILIEQNQQQARQILVENPLLTRTLFQAQIMLGMVQPPQVMPNIQPAPSQHPQQSARPVQQQNIQGSHPFPVQVGQQDQTSAPQTQLPVRKQHQNQPMMPNPSASVPPVQTMPSHSLQTAQQQPKGHLNTQIYSTPLSQTSQMHNITPLPLHSTPMQPAPLQSHVSSVSSQPQQSFQTSGIPLMPLQPPLPQQPRPPSMPPFTHQPHSQMGPNMGFQPSGTPQPYPAQPAFHSGTKPPASIGSSFSQGMPPLPNQPPPQSLYQVGGSHSGTDFSNKAATPMQAERGPVWMPGPQENAPGPPPLVPGHMGPTSQPPQPPQLTSEMENALLYQVMNLTPDQINLLPPEQRNQVLQLQQMIMHQ